MLTVPGKHSQLLIVLFMMVNMEFPPSAPSPIAIMGWTLPLCVHVCACVGVGVGVGVSVWMGGCVCGGGGGTVQHYIRQTCLWKINALLLEISTYFAGDKCVYHWR